MSFLQGLANAADTFSGSSSIRDLLAGEPAFDQFLAPTSPDNRVSGHTLLQQYGLAGEDPGISGAIAEMALDPVNLISGLGIIGAALRATKFNKALGAVSNPSNAGALLNAINFGRSGPPAPLRATRFVRNARPVSGPRELSLLMRMAPRRPEGPMAAGLGMYNLPRGTHPLHYDQLESQRQAELEALMPVYGDDIDRYMRGRQEHEEAAQKSNLMRFLEYQGM